MKLYQYYVMKQIFMREPSALQFSKSEDLILNLCIIWVTFAVEHALCYTFELDDE